MSDPISDPLTCREQAAQDLNSGGGRSSGSLLPNASLPVASVEATRIGQAIGSMWQGLVPSRFETGECLEWAVGVQDCLPGSSLYFIVEPLPDGQVGQVVKSHLVVEKSGHLFDCRGRHPLDAWGWDMKTTLVVPVSPLIIRGLTHGVPLSLPGHPDMSRGTPFNEELAAAVAQEFLRHYAPPVSLSSFLDTLRAHASCV